MDPQISSNNNIYIYKYINLPKTGFSWGVNPKIGMKSLRPDGEVPPFFQRHLEGHSSCHGSRRLWAPAPSPGTAPPAVLRGHSNSPLSAPERMGFLRDDWGLFVGVRDVRDRETHLTNKNGD